MMLAGTAHFVVPDVYLGIMPPWLPQPGLLVLASGAAEIAAGVAVLIPGTRRLGGWMAIAVFVAVFPANVWMAVEPTVWPELPLWARWARLPFQGVLIAWAWWVALRR
jgi:uncharacterized membrane protein